MSQQRENKGGKRLFGMGDDAQTTKKAKPKREGKALILHRVYVGLTIAAAAIVAGFVLWNLFSAPPEIDSPSRPMTTTVVDEEGNEVAVEIPGLTAGRKKQFYTFLLVGQDTFGGGNTDTMMLVAYDVPNQSLNVMSLPRDTYVNYNGRKVLLNSVYNRAGGSKDDKGITALKKEVGELTGVTPDYHVLIQWDAVGKLVDAIDGVDFDVPRRMYYNDLSQDFKINLQAGFQHLDGDQAMQLIRWRHNSDDKGNILNSGYANGDLGRIQTQQDFMKAVIKKCLQPEVLLPNLGEYIQIFQENVVTNLSVSNMTYFGKSAVGGLDMDHVQFATMPWKDAGDGAHVLPVASKLLEEINASFNPYQDEIRLGELDAVTSIDSTAKSTPKPAATTPAATRESTPAAESTAPAETAAGTDPVVPPEASHTPAHSAAPSQAPEETQTPAATAAPAATQTPPAATPTPAPTEEAPLLPPGA